MFSKYFKTEEARYELKKVKTIEQEINKDRLIHKTGNKKKDKTYYFQKSETILSFGREIYSSILTLNVALEEQINLKDGIDKFKESAKPKPSEK